MYTAVLTFSKQNYEMNINILSRLSKVSHLLRMYGTYSTVDFIVQNTFVACEPTAAGLVLANVIFNILLYTRAIPKVLFLDLKTSFVCFCVFKFLEC